jgi:hypothetical protein
MGVAVGVFVVTAMAAAVHGIRASFQGDVDAFGATSFQVRRRGIQLGGCDGTDDTCPERRNPALTLREAAAIRRLPSVQAVTVWWDESRPFRYRDRYLQSVGYDAFSEADLAFHEAVAVASGNTMIQVSNEVVRDTVLSVISDKIAHARNSKALMRRSLEHHEQVLEAIRSGDGPAAARASVQSLYDYYAGYVPASERHALRALLDA